MQGAVVITNQLCWWTEASPVPTFIYLNRAVLMICHDIDVHDNNVAMPPDRRKACPYVISFQRMERKVMRTGTSPVPTEARPPCYLSIQLLFNFINIKTLKACYASGQPIGCPYTVFLCRE